MAADSDRRRGAYLQTGCNAFQSAKPSSKPLGFWLEDDVLRYIRDNSIPYAKEIYGDIVEGKNGKLTTTRETRTGCYVCPFGQSRRLPQGAETRYQRLKHMYPKLYDYCMRPLDENGLGVKPVLDFLEIPYE